MSKTTKKTTTKNKKPAAKKTEAKAEKKPKEELCVFAFRLTAEERVAIHKAAGPGKASKFARSLLVAAARKDEATVKSIMTEAQSEA
jgi:hypothetical protein